MQLDERTIPWAAERRPECKPVRRDLYSSEVSVVCTVSDVGCEASLQVLVLHVTVATIAVRGLMALTPS